ncbi:hypothetical protein L21SP5_00238 [Salinivirga cyanobacteriivorans]|uniref:YARHG domain-containing protein n=1 Tax=Salinivirga cyanobacteriivorans TaxID=1307839 RepID=A0A0S2HV72_9BACT|nr:YARHG domain-containing protein [Salinivirga cyanobacteriivorans]ALO13918.1 hypothetical protein L21SP5_00238 [Salinivirga cyanobacteriivorans]
MKKRTIVIIISFLTLWQISFSQVEFKLDTVIKTYNAKYNNDYKGIYIYDTLFIEILAKKFDSKSCNLFVNGRPLDCNNTFFKNPFKIDEFLFIQTPDSKKNGKLKFVQYSFEDSVFKDFGYSYSRNQQDSFIQDNSFKRFYHVIKNNEFKIKTANFLNKKGKEIADFDPFIKKTYFEGLGDIYYANVEEVLFFESNSAIIQICMNPEGADCSNYRFFIATAAGVKEIKDLFKFDVLNGYLLEMLFIDESQKTVRLNNRIYDQDRPNPLYYEGYILDIEKLKKKKVLAWINNIELISGINIQGNDIKHYFLLSNLDSKNKVIIPYKFIPQLDLAMYKGHQNEKLTKDDIKGLDLYTLGILRNSIFAKYNYAFSSEFYQAYFNLFAFYNHYEKKGKRTKNINDKLTETDKFNIKLITNTEKELGK